MSWTSENTNNAVQAGGGIASSLINVIGQSYINRQNIEEQRRAQAVAQQNWREQQEYNSPKNQVARIKEAGLNPDMLYGQSSAGVAGNAATPAQSINPPVLNPIQLDPMTASNIYKNIADIALAKSQEKKNLSEADKTDNENLTETERRRSIVIQNYINEQTQDDVIAKIKDEGITAYHKRIQEQMNVSDSTLDLLIRYKALGIDVSVTQAGELRVDWSKVDNTYFSSERFQKALTAYVTSNYDMPLEQIKQVQEAIKTLTSEQSVNYASASNLASEEEVFSTQAEKNRYEKLVEFADFYTTCVQNGISIDWSKNPPEIVKSTGGTVSMTIVNKLLTLVQGVFGIAVKKTF